MPFSPTAAQRSFGVALWAAAVAFACGLAGPVVAQKPGGATTKAATTVATTAPLTPVVSFGAMVSAVAQQDYTVEQRRRFVGAQGAVVTVRERVRVDADGSEAPPFEVTFLGVEGELPGSAVSQQWQQTYNRFGALFHRHGSFSVRDLVKVQQNYLLHDFGAVTRAGRQAVRTVVFPMTTDKSIWVVDVDAATMVPVYWAEFDFQFHLLAEVEAISFVPSLATPLQPPSPLTVKHADFAAARVHMGNPTGLIEPPVQLANYAITEVETRDDPLNGQQKVVLTYTDGVDQFLVVETPATSDVFASLLPADKDGTPTTTGNTIARFQDASMRVLLFWEDGVSFQVAGRGSLERLDGVARQLYLQALSTN